MYDHNVEMSGEQVIQRVIFQLCIKTGVKVGQYGPVLRTTRRFSAGTQYREQGTAAACQNPHTTHQNHISNKKTHLLMIGQHKQQLVFL